MHFHVTLWESNFEKDSQTDILIYSTWICSFVRRRTTGSVGAIRMVGH